MLKYLAITSLLILSACGERQYEIVAKKFPEARNAEVLTGINEQLALAQHQENCEPSTWQGEDVCRLAYLSLEEVVSGPVLERMNYEIGTAVIPLNAGYFAALESYGDGYNISIRTTYGKDGDGGPLFIEQELQTPIYVFYKREKPS